MNGIRVTNTKYLLRHLRSVYQRIACCKQPCASSFSVSDQNVVECRSKYARSSTTKSCGTPSTLACMLPRLCCALVSLSACVATRTTFVCYGTPLFMILFYTSGNNVFRATNPSVSLSLSLSIGVQSCIILATVCYPLRCVRAIRRGYRGRVGLLSPHALPSALSLSTPRQPASKHRRHH